MAEFASNLGGPGSILNKIKVWGVLLSIPPILCKESVVRESWQGGSVGEDTCPQVRWPEFCPRNPCVRRREPALASSLNSTCAAQRACTNGLKRAWWLMPVFLILQSEKQEDFKFKAT